MKVNLAKAQAGGQGGQVQGNRAGTSLSLSLSLSRFPPSLSVPFSASKLTFPSLGFACIVWSSETWLKEHALPLGQSGGVEEARPEESDEKVEEEEEEVELEQ